VSILSKLVRSASQAGEMPFLEHLEELRWRIIWSLLALGGFMVLAFFLVQWLPVLQYLIRPIEPYLEGEKLKVLSPTTPFFLTMKLALWIGLILASPVIIYHVWSFVSPALLPKEKRAIVPALYMGLLLFIGGVALAYYMVLPLSLRFMMQFQMESLEPAIVAGEYLGFVVQLLLAFGIMFEMPVLIMVLSALGIVHSRMLASGRRYALVLITIGASLVTPADVLSTILLMAPLLLLYELSIAIAKLIERNRARAAAEDPWVDSPWAAQ
jgi:sec-independent protein translocase protein TatC